jgi:hypothetical protein
MYKIKGIYLDKKTDAILLEEKEQGVFKDLIYTRAIPFLHLSKYELVLAVNHGQYKLPFCTNKSGGVFIDENGKIGYEISSPLYDIKKFFDISHFLLNETYYRTPWQGTLYFLTQNN